MMTRNRPTRHIWEVYENQADIYVELGEAYNSKWKLGEFHFFLICNEFLLALLLAQVQFTLHSPLQSNEMQVASYQRNVQTLIWSQISLKLKFTSWIEKKSACDNKSENSDPPPPHPHQAQHQILFMQLAGCTQGFSHCPVSNHPPPSSSFTLLNHILPPSIPFMAPTPFACLCICHWNCVSQADLTHVLDSTGKM